MNTHPEQWAALYDAALVNMVKFVPSQEQSGAFTVGKIGAPIFLVG